MLRSILPIVALATIPLALAKSAGAQTADAAPLAQIIRQCVLSKWQTPAKSNGEQLPTIKVRLRFKPDGTFATAPVIANPQNVRHFVTTSNSVVMAIQACTPLRLPSAQYELWKDIVLTFDPRDVPNAPNPSTASPGERSEGVTRPSGITQSAENDEFGRAVMRSLRQIMPKPVKSGRVTLRLILSDNGRLQEMHLVIG